MLKFGTVLPMNESEHTNLMRIEQNHPIVPGVEVAKPGKSSAAVANPTETDLNESRRLDQALAKTAEVRADQVARARALVADPNYPSHEQLGKIADVLAANWQHGD